MHKILAVRIKEVVLDIQTKTMHSQISNMTFSSTDPNQVNDITLKSPATVYSSIDSSNIVKNVVHK